MTSNDVRESSVETRLKVCGDGDYLVEFCLVKGGIPYNNIETVIGVNVLGSTQRFTE